MLLSGHDPRSVVVVGLCLYETGAIISGRVPTITSLAWRTRNTWWGRAAIWHGIGYLAYHLLLEDAVAMVEEALEELAAE